jgi:hypothetical protein
VNSTAVTFFEKSSGNAIVSPVGQRRTTPEDDAHYHTGYLLGTRKPNLGVAIVRRANGLVKIAFDLIRIDVNLRADTIEELRNRWLSESAAFSKALLKSASRRAHFSKTFASFEVEPSRLDAWKRKLSIILSDPKNFDLIDPGNQETDK